MKKMKDFDIIASVVEELEDEYGYNTSILDKKAFNIKIDPASILGALTGAAVAKKKVTNDLMKQNFINEQKQNELVGGSYYKQVENIADNLKVVFTPFSVVIIIKNGTQQITIDTIETEEMDSNMHAAYVARDAEYFKRLILNKIQSEIQMAEQLFAKNIVQKQLELQSQLQNKKASLDLDFTDVLDGVRGLKAVFEKNADSVLGDFLMKTADAGEIWSIDIGLDDIRPLSKYASVFKDTLKFFGLNTDRHNIREIQGKMLDPNYLKGKLKVSFLPNRVLFIVDNIVITQLPVTNMNEEGFAAFEKNDQQYFKDVFTKEMTARKKNEFSKGKKLTIGDIVKEASVLTDVKEIFTTSDIHPKIYFEELTGKMGEEWLSYDPEVLIKEIEDLYEPEKGIGDIPLNKILFLQVINNSPIAFTSRHAFEKCVRTMNDKPIDFEQREANLDLGEIVFALEVMQDLTPNKDIFVDFSEEVFIYIADILAANNFRVAFPEFIIDSDTEREFYVSLNAKLLELWDTIVTEGLTDKERIKQLKAENKLINATGVKLVKFMREADAYSPEEIEAAVDKLQEKLGLQEHVRNIIVSNLEGNMATDLYLQYREAMFNMQKEVYRKA